MNFQRLVYTAFAVILLSATSLLAQKKTRDLKYHVHPLSENRYEKIKIQLNPSSDQEMVTAVTNYYSWLEKSGCSLTIRSRVESPKAYHITFQQQVDNIPVYNGSVKVNMEKSGLTFSFMNHLLEINPAIQGDFHYTLEDVSQWAEQEGNGEGQFDYDVEQNYLAMDAGLLPVYKIQTIGNDVTGSYEVLLDANNLEEISRIDRAVYHHHAIMPGDTNAKSRIFVPDPLTSSGNTYGGMYVDNSDNTAPWLEAEQKDVILKDVNYIGGVFRLEGPHVKIEDIEAPTMAPVTSSNDEFYYTRNQGGFEDAMVYYHIDTMQRYIKFLGFTNLQNLGFRVDPHGLNGADNSHFVPGAGGSDSYVALGEGCVDDAEDADVIIHEYGHAISHAAAPGTNSGFERSGLDEGIGDYMAASYSYDINTFRWEDVFTWDGHNTCWDGREADHSSMYPPSTTWDFYLYGEIWATTLMEARQDIGAVTADRVFFQELYSNVADMTLPDAAMNILDADTLHNSGAYSSTYIHYFCARGILTGGICALANDDVNISDDISIYPNPATDKVSVELGQELMKQNPIVTIYDMLGKVHGTQLMNSSSTTFDVSDLSSGVYLLRVEADGSALHTEKVIIE